MMSVLLFTGGCEAFMEALEAGSVSTSPINENYEPRFVVGIFSVVPYPRGGELEKELQLPDGSTLIINANHNFSSKRIREVKVVPRPGNPDRCDLAVKIDKSGRLQWEMLAGYFRGEAVVFVVDGRYVCRFYPDMPEENNNDWVTMRVGIDSYTAKGIAKYAKDNFVYYNPDSSSIWSYL
jgi:hypothetical protein